MKAYLSLVLVFFAACDRDPGRGRGPGGGGGPDMAVKQCTGLECDIARDCAENIHTTITGTVFAPNGTLPLYNVTVFIPNSPLDPITDGVSCDRCDGKVSGNPIAITQTDAAGHFELVDVPGVVPGSPSGLDIPLVMQVGRWRRMVYVSAPKHCETLNLGDPDMTRLPRTKAEGNIPRIAMVTGGADPFECLLRKVGIADQEVTIPTAAGRVHFYKENGRDIAAGPAPAASTLWSSAQTLANYDVVILACEGSPTAHAGGYQNLINYLDAGGRVFTTHYSYAWLNYSTPMTSPYNVVGMPWHPDSGFPSDPLPGTIDQSFPKGKAFAEWLKNVVPGSTLGHIDINDPRHDLDLVNPEYAQK